MLSWLNIDPAIRRPDTGDRPTIQALANLGGASLWSGSYCTRESSHERSGKPRYGSARLEATDRPFVRDDIKTDGVEVFYRDELIPTQIEAASRRGQQAMRDPIKDRLMSIQYQDGSAVYWIPAPGIVIDPRVQFLDCPGHSREHAYLRRPSTGVAKELGIERAVRRFDLSTERVEENAIAFEDRLASLN